MFVGYNERDLIEGIFTIPGKTRVLEPVSIGSSIISVDSTIGFGESGSVVCGSDTITYTTKSVNQFFGCSGVTSAIDIASDIRSSENIFGYENGNLEQKCELRITGVISKFVPVRDISLADEQEKITVKNIGEKIENPSQDATYKEIFANSWIYNTSTRYHIEGPITGSQTTFVLLSPIDKSSLKIGDIVDIVQRNQQDIRVSDAKVTAVDLILNQVTLTNITWASGHPYISSHYDIRRKLSKASSKNTAIPLKDGNNNILTDILNVYTDDEKYGYAASNSLPSYEVDVQVIESSIPDGTAPNLGGYDDLTKTYSQINFATDHEFIDGDIITYKPEGEPLVGLTAGAEYYVFGIATNKIKLYSSLGQLYNTSQHLKYGEKAGVHRFILKRHTPKKLSSNKICRFRNTLSYFHFFRCIISMNIRVIFIYINNESHFIFIMCYILSNII